VDDQLRAKRLPALHTWLQRLPPTHLWHYTSPVGLLGIAKDAQIWASHGYWLNDAQEQEIARGNARAMLDHSIENGDYADDDELHALEEMRKRGIPPQPAKQAFTVSISEEPDQLSQWRAYCPDAAGYGIGFPSAHLRDVGEEQGFYLAPCVYSTDPQAWALVAEIVNYHRHEWRLAVLADAGSKDSATEAAVKGLYEDLGLFGPLFKHFSFSDEREWRLISVVWMQDPRVKHRVGLESVMPYVPVDLLTPSYPAIGPAGGPPEETVGVYIGPRRDHPSDTDAVRPSVKQNESTYAVRSLFEKSRLTLSWVSYSPSPYRGA
jgi:hypothetical protein